MTITTNAATEAIAKMDVAIARRLEAGESLGDTQPERNIRQELYSAELRYRARNIIADLHAQGIRVSQVRRRGAHLEAGLEMTLEVGSASARLMNAAK